MIDRYGILDTLSQGEDREMSSENERVEKVANDIRRAVGCCTDNEGQYGHGYCNAISALNELGKRCDQLSQTLLMLLSVLQDLKVAVYIPC